jgi:tripartite-type tricarboxylate transporter receptor subunit TctC
MINRRSLLQIGALAAPALLLGREAQAEDWPTRPVTMMVPFAPGGSSDIIGRAMAQRMAEALGKPVVVENRAGATGELGARVLARAAPDGYLLMAAPISTFAINKALRPNLGYDPVTDFTNLTQSVSTPNVLVVNPRVPANNLQELIAWLKKDGDQASYSSSGVGSSDHLTMELFKQLTGTNPAHVPYSGGGPATTDLMGGTVQLSSQNLGFITPFIRDKRVKAIAVTAAQRHPLLPDVPTAAEGGLENFVVSSWQAVAAPPRMPAPLVEKVHAAVVASLRHPETVKQMELIGFTIVASSPAEFAEFQKKEIERWTEVVRKGNIRAE